MADNKPQKLGLTKKTGEDVESPVEQKIHDLVDAQPPSGWGLTENAPKDGNRIVLSDNGLDHGVAAYWRNTRKVDKAKLRYVPTGRWTDILTGAEINPVPRFFKPYSAEEYFPLNAPVQKTGIVG